ncbi:PREDICTED: XK-related protein 6-like [Cyphomyrmex costatus]|uniref:XK-related protein 6-like n=1 Tax=Cyphomyrmex costatus TaxID=456900 RepID=UPI0008523548|nr:PREDICTED: XK-related protein 6-like [Cyphomyrmex costatus]
MEERNCERRPFHLASVFPGIHFDVDLTDLPTDTPRISRLDIFLLVCSIIMHVVDMGFDYNIAIQYYLGGKVTYFAWTMFLILVPSFINVVISRRMQLQDKETSSSTSDSSNDYRTTHLLIKNGLYCTIAIFLQLAPVIHYWETLKCALKARKCKKSGDRVNERKYYIRMLKEDQDVALLRVFECFLEAAPQQILQLTLMLKHYHNEINFEFVHQVASIVSSLASMGWAMASYHRSIRLAQQNKLNIGVVGTVLQFLWHFSITVARILSLSVIASIWPLYTLFGCSIHWLIMTVWILVNSHGILEFCRAYGRPPHMLPTLKERIYSILFATVIGIVYIFIYLNTIDSNTFWKHLCFYMLCFVENIISILLWRYTSPPEVREAWYFNVFFIICFISILLGIIAIILYYTRFHPSKKQRTSNSLQVM